MKDAFERRALLLHLGDMLEAVNGLLKCGGNYKTVHELAAGNVRLQACRCSLKYRSG